MATRSRVGLELSDGSILSIYSHWDGYPEWAGRILKTHYNSKELAEQLIDGGGVSCLWTDKDWNGNEWTECKYKALTYAERGEDCPPRLDPSVDMYLEYGEEYAYLFKNGEWICYHMHQFENDKNPEIVEIPEVALAV